MNIGGKDGQEAMRARCNVMADALKAALRRIAECETDCKGILTATIRCSAKLDAYRDLAAILSDPAVVKAIEGKE